MAEEIKADSEAQIIEVEPAISVQSEDGGEVNFPGDRSGNYAAKANLKTIYHGAEQRNVFHIEEYKLRYHINEYKYSHKESPDWYSMIGLFTTLLITLLTANFKDWVLTATTWQTIFELSLIASIIWLAVRGGKYLVYRNKNPNPIEKLIENIKSKS